MSAGAQSGQVVSGAATDAVFSQLGAGLLQQYCFPAGTPITTKRGEVPIEQIEIGDQVLAADEHDPDGPLGWKPVTQLYRNAPAELINIHAGNLPVVRATLNHPFYVRGKGFVAAVELKPGDLLRTADDRYVPVTESFRNGDIEPVFNFAVADHHTYFACGVLVHNQSFAPPVLPEAEPARIEPELPAEPGRVGPLQGRFGGDPPEPLTPEGSPQVDYVTGSGSAGERARAYIKEGFRAMYEPVLNSKINDAIGAARANGVPEDVIQRTINAQGFPATDYDSNIRALNGITADYWAKAHPEEAKALNDRVAAMYSGGIPGVPGTGRWRSLAEQNPSAGGGAAEGQPEGTAGRGESPAGVPKTAAGGGGIGKVPPVATGGKDDDDDDEGTKIAAGAARGFDVLQCEECATSVRSALQKAGQHGEVVEIRANEGDFIVADGYDNAISQNGRHVGVRVGNTVFDNLHPEGIEYEAWLKEFDAQGGITVHSVTEF